MTETWLLRRKTPVGASNKINLNSHCKRIPYICFIRALPSLRMSPLKASVAEAGR